MQADHGLQRLLVLALASWLLGSPSAVRAADDGAAEVTAFVITSWDAGCDANRIDDWDNMVRAWYNAVRDVSPPPDGHGDAAWSIGWINNDGYIVDSQFIDPNCQPWGNDVEFLEVPDAFMAGLHGGNDTNDHRWKGRVKYNEDGPGNCSAYQGDIRLGEGDLEFLHLSSCFSMDREDWWNEWNSSFNGLHQVDGFHGIMYIGEGYIRDYRHFADDSFWISMADAWLDNLYDSPWFVSNHDQCPVVRVVGTDESDCLFRLDSERYTNVLSDPPGITGSRSHMVKYIDGCNPRGKEEL